MPEEGGAIAEDKDLTVQFSVLKKGKTSLCYGVKGFRAFQGTQVAIALGHRYGID